MVLTGTVELFPDYAQLFRNRIREGLPTIHSGCPGRGQLGGFRQNLVLVGLSSRQTLADHVFSIRAALLTVGDFWLMRFA